MRVCEHGVEVGDLGTVYVLRSSFGQHEILLIVRMVEGCYGEWHGRHEVVYSDNYATGVRNHWSVEEGQWIPIPPTREE